MKFLFHSQSDLWFYLKRFSKADLYQKCSHDTHKRVNRLRFIVVSNQSCASHIRYGVSLVEDSKSLYKDSKSSK